MKMTLSEIKQRTDPEALGSDTIQIICYFFRHCVITVVSFLLLRNGKYTIPR